jgi:LCP family protein required for cell wall assembly
VNEWPTGWFRNEKPASPDRAAGVPGSSDPASEPTGRYPVADGGGGAGSAGAGSAGARPAGEAGPAALGASPRAGVSTAGSAWPQQPPPRSAPGDFPPPARPGYGGGRVKLPRSRGRLVLKIVAAAVAVLLALVVALYFFLDSKLQRANVLADYSGRPAAAAGTNWLITGSDSRQGLTRKQERQLATGVDIGGHRSDTILVLHLPPSGRPILISIPRDSYVDIPGYGWNKINAAYSFGGPRLLAKTVQDATGLRIEHYMGIGFGGLVNVVNAIGGVRMCLPRALHDRAAGLHLKKGCQTLNGAQALGFVRTRHTFAGQDLQREQNQRIFIAALLSKMTSLGTIINPFAVLPAAFGSAGSLKVDEGTHLYQLVSVAFALRHPETTTVPIANANLPTSAGDAVQWDHAQATELFNDLNAGRPVPKSLLTGSRLRG